MFEGLGKHEKLVVGLATATWVAGGFIARNEYELAQRAKTPNDRAMHQDRASSYTLWSNVGVGVFGLLAFKHYPKTTTALVLTGLGLNWAVSAMSLPNRWNEPKRQSPLPAPPQDPISNNDRGSMWPR